MHSVYHFDIAKEAIDASRTGALAPGSIIVIDEDCIVALASDTLYAVTTHHGSLKPFTETSRSSILEESPHDAAEIARAVDEAFRQGFPVNDTLEEFGSLRSEMAACAREYRLTSDEVLALVEACDKRIADYTSLQADHPETSPAYSVGESARAHLEGARRKLLDRPL